MTAIPRTCPIMPRAARYFNNSPRSCTRPVISPEGVRYASVTEASKLLERPLSTVHGWLRRSTVTGWRYGDGPASPTAEG